MYPLYWTIPVRRVIFMRYTYEFKRKCVEMYRQGMYPQTPEGLSDFRFHKTVRHWVRLEEAQGPEALQHKHQNKIWTPETKLELISQVIAGRACAEVAIANGINPGQLYQWVQKYKTKGYNGLVDKKKGRSPKELQMEPAESKTPASLTESEREELMRLRAEIEYIKAENEVIKKEIALREQKQAALLKSRKQQSSKNSVKKDIS